MALQPELIMMVANAWDAGHANPTSKHRIAIDLIRRGKTVLWVEGAGMRTPKAGSHTDRQRIFRRLRKALQLPKLTPTDALGELRINSRQGRLFVFSPLLLPFPKRAAIRAWNGWWCWLLIYIFLTTRRFKIYAIINYVPVLSSLMRLYSGVPQIYHCVDRWDAFAEYDSQIMAITDQQCCEIADFVVASSKDLTRRCQRFNPETRLLSHGVDYEHFARTPQIAVRPDDLPAGEILGFFGLLSDWVDQGLLVDLASKCADKNIVLIGNADCDVSRLKNKENIVLLGPKPFKELPKYIASFSVGLIPFQVTELTIAVNPIKLREMLSAGCRVVSTALPEVAELSDGESVMVARTHEEFIDFVKACGERSWTIDDKKRLSRSMEKEAWSEKVTVLLTWIDELRRLGGVG